MSKEQSKLKLGKRSTFVKTHLKQLEQMNDTWEADFRALPKPKGQAETHYLGLVVALPKGNPLVCHAGGIHSRTSTIWPTSWPMPCADR